MRENRPSGSEGGAGEKPLFLPLSITQVAPEEAVGTPFGLQTPARAISLPAT
jgi:hypothetical protein